MINEKVLKLKRDQKLPNGLDFKVGTEFVIVMDVVYMGGFPLPSNLQATVYNWIVNNPTFFLDTTKNW